MPVLENVRHERFAQALASGLTAADAYVEAGYSRNDGNSSRLKGDERIAARVEEILAAAGTRVEITQARVLAELGKIGFSDIRRAVKWYSQANIAAVDDVEGEIEDGTIRMAVANQVELVSSDEIDDDTAAAISEVSMSDKGTIKVKFHDKRAALVDIGKHLGMFRERVEHSGPNGGPIEIGDTDLARLIAFQLSKATKGE
jgi:phage terminase small subunit